MIIRTKLLCSLFTRLFSLLFISFIYSNQSLARNIATQCNGSSDLCERRYNEITYATTHNAQSDQKNPILSIFPGSNISNQERSIWDQLKDGIHAMKIPVHLHRHDDSATNSTQEEAFACHGLRSGVKDIIKARLCDRLFSFLENSCKKIVTHLSPCTFDPAAQKLEKILVDIGQFMKQHPNEIITLFIEDYTNNFRYLDKIFRNSRITPLMHSQDPDQEWPTLDEMIRTNKRLVVFVNHEHDQFGDNIYKYKLFNNQSDFIWGSKFHFETVEELEEDTPGTFSDSGFPLLAREIPLSNKLRVLQHFTTPSLGGSEQDAQVVNSAPILRERVQKYEHLTGAKPNFIWVDFYDLPAKGPGVFQVVNELNQSPTFKLSAKSGF